MKVREICNRVVIVAQGDTVLSEAGYLMRDRAVARDARAEVTARGE